MKFSEFDIPENIKKAIKKMGFEDLTPIQEKTLPVIKEGRDICAIAETGSGKTAACVIPMLSKIDVSSRTLQGLVVVPTRELCMQYVDEIDKIAEYTGIIPFGIYGGLETDIQAGKFKHGVHVLVATPGRLMDVIYNGRISLSNIKAVVLDEVDELLNEGFLEDTRFILSCIRQKHQTLLFSATMPSAIKELANEQMENPVHITLISDQKMPKSLTHQFIFVHPNDKKKELLRYIQNEDIQQAIIFSNSRSGVDSLYHDLKREVKDIDFIHGGLQQRVRSSIFRKFKNKKLRYLIATDVAGRGLDFSHVTHILNLDFPREREQYTHRTGRAGRMGRKGKAVSFIIRKDLPKLRSVIKTHNIQAVWLGENPFEKGEDKKLKRHWGKNPRYKQGKGGVKPHSKNIPKKH